ncbi:MAG: hypothetical protein ABSH28_18800 [Acidobacteriota bacterium]
MGLSRARRQGLIGIVYAVPTKVDVVYAYKNYRAGDVFYVLTYLGEGFAKVWYKGTVYEDDIHTLVPTGFGPWEDRPLRCPARP